MLSKYYTGDTYKKYEFVDDIEDIQKLIEFIMGTPEHGLIQFDADLI